MQKNVINVNANAKQFMRSVKENLILGKTHPRALVGFDPLPLQAYRGPGFSTFSKKPALYLDVWSRLFWWLVRVSMWRFLPFHLLHLWNLNVRWEVIDCSKYSKIKKSIKLLYIITKPPIWTQAVLVSRWKDRAHVVHIVILDILLLLLYAHCYYYLIML